MSTVGLASSIGLACAQPKMVIATVLTIAASAADTFILHSFDKGAHGSTGDQPRQMGE